MLDVDDDEISLNEEIANSWEKNLMPLYFSTLPIGIHANICVFGHF